MAVYIVNQPQPRSGKDGFVYDVSPAMQYGELIFVYRADQPPPSNNPDWATAHAYEVLADFSDDDFLVWAGGDPLGMVIVSAVAADVNQGGVKYLKWERERDRDRRRTGNGYYVPLALSINE